MILTVTFEVDDKHLETWGAYDWSKQMESEIDRLRGHSECGLKPVSYEYSSRPGWVEKFPQRQR